MTRRAIASTMIAFVAIGLVWAVAMPPNAAPDEDQHMIWASTTARLQLEPSGPDEALKAPSVLYRDRCWQWHPERPVTCQDEIPVRPQGDERNRPVRNAVPYYAIVGSASLFTSTEATVYLMRFAHILVTASVLTLGVWAMSARRFTPGSIALATVGFTPMAAFLLGTVNPSGTAIAAGFALWAAGLFLVGSRRSTLSIILGMVVPAVVLVIVRRDAFVWLVPILVILGLRYGPRRLVDSLRTTALRGMVRRPVVRALLLLSPVIVAVALLFGSDDILRLFRGKAGGDLAGTASSAFGILPYYVNEMIGQLGWVDVTMPQPVLMGWYGLIAVAIIITIGASRRDGIAVLVVVGAVLVIPYLFGVLYRYRYFQGRYGLPLALGVPMIAAAAHAVEHRSQVLNARMARAIVWTVAALSSVAFAVALRRFTVGDRGSWPDVFFDPSWSPPLPAYVLVAVYAAVMAAVAVTLSRIIGRCAPRELEQHASP